MKISGCTIARLAVTQGYPIAESIRSLLPIVDEYVIGVGDPDDGTWEAVQSIGDSRIKAFRSDWDLSLRGGNVISEETNKALDRCTGDWIVYLQADEVLHERDLPRLRAELEQYLSGPIESLSFPYLHFYGSFAFVQDDPGRWYRRATRAVKNGSGARSIGDGCAFGIRSGDGWRRPRRARSSVPVYHYGWARPPDVMLAKTVNFDRLYHDQTWIAENRNYTADAYTERGHLRRFMGDHPAVMRDRAAATDWTFDPQLERQWPDVIRRPWVFARWIVREAWWRARRLAGR